jgi:hypothetical protein
MGAGPRKEEGLLAAGSQTEGRPVVGAQLASRLVSRLEEKEASGKHSLHAEKPNKVVVSTGRAVFFFFFFFSLQNRITRLDVSFNLRIMWGRM